MRQVTAELTVYVIDEGSMRRLYRTERRTKKETPYFYIKNNKAEYLTAAEVLRLPEDWLIQVPVRNN
jgi:hypothetical protein